MSFLYPYSFLLLVFLVLFFIKKEKFNINPKLIVNKQSTKLKNIFLALAYIFMVIALARPVTNKQEINTNANVKKVALALDISRSMLAYDVYPNRLTFAKQKMKQFIDKFNGEMAIMAFSTDAFLISPYTSDKSTLKYLLDNIDTSYVTASGTDFNNLINTAKRMGYKDLIVFSDGGDIKYLDTKGINLYLLLIGSTKGSPIKLKNGNLFTENGKVVIVKVNTNLEKYAKFATIATASDSDITALIHQNFSSVKNNKKIVVYKELFIYPLSLAVLFLFLAFFSLPKIVKITPIFLLFLTTNSKAGILDWYYINEANKAYKEGDYNKSAKLFKELHQNYNYANSLYKLKKYQEALKVYKNLKQTEKVIYNEANCLAKMKKIDEAIKKYKEALKLNPKDKDAKYNLELLEKLKQKNKQKNKQHKKSNKNQKQSNKDKKNNKSNNNQNKNKNHQNKKENNKKQNSNKQQDKNHQQKKNNDKKKQNKESKQNLNKVNQSKLKPVKIVPKKEADQIFNKIHTKTLIYPLSKGEIKNDY